MSLKFAYCSQECVCSQTFLVSQNLYAQTGRRGEGKNGLNNFFLARICYFRDKGVAFARHCNFANLTFTNQICLQILYYMDGEA